MYYGWGRLVSLFVAAARVFHQNVNVLAQSLQYSQYKFGLFSKFPFRNILAMPVYQNDRRTLLLVFFHGPFREPEPKVQRRNEIPCLRTFRSHFYVPGHVAVCIMRHPVATTYWANKHISKLNKGFSKKIVNINRNHRYLLLVRHFRKKACSLRGCRRKERNLPSHTMLRATFSSLQYDYVSKSLSSVS